MGFTVLFQLQSAPMLDGTFIWYNSLPGSNIPGQNLGMTLVHEVGALCGIAPHVPPVDLVQCIAAVNCD